jgi:hypothetical protein
VEAQEPFFKLLVLAVQVVAGMEVPQRQVLLVQQTVAVAVAEVQTLQTEALVVQVLSL